MGRRVSCQYCGRVVTVRNKAKHLRQSCRVWDPRGGGRTAVSGQRRRNARRRLRAKRARGVEQLEDEVVRIIGKIKGIDYLQVLFLLLLSLEA